MELIQTATISSWLISLFKILHWDIKILNFFSDIHLFLYILLTKWIFWIAPTTGNIELINKQNCFNEIFSDETLCREELNMVVERLGINCDLDGESFGENEFSRLFEDEEPSLEEIKEAFEVFDENKDGFIDATELQRVLCNLGTDEGLELERCRRMISAFDENGDGFIDFGEFVKFMEKCFG